MHETLILCNGCKKRVIETITLGHVSKAVRLVKAGELVATETEQINK